MHDDSTLSFSTLRQDSLLIGEYELDSSYASWMANSTASISATAYFPSADLVTLLEEDATNLILQRKLVSPLTDEELFRDISASYRNRKSDSHALLTLKGYKATPNQDRSILVRFSVNATNTKTKGVKNHKQSNEALLMGIFDGHGDQGHKVSQYVALELPKVFGRTIEQQQQLTGASTASTQINPVDPRYNNLISQVFKATFLKIDANEPIQGSGGGTTASTFFYPGIGPNLYLANVGDSTTIIAHYSTSSRRSTIVKQNRRDKPHLPEERKRIEESGGTVYIPFQLKTKGSQGPEESSRLLITLEDGSTLGLAMSRSIGDVEGKKFGLVAEPTVDVFDVEQYYLEQQFSKQQMKESEWFAAVASDGLYDVIPRIEVIQSLGESLFGRSSIECTCEVLIRKAGRLWIRNTAASPYRDDITLGVSKIWLKY